MSFHANFASLSAVSVNVKSDKTAVLNLTYRYSRFIKPSKSPVFKLSSVLFSNILKERLSYSSKPTGCICVKQSMFLEIQMLSKCLFHSTYAGIFFGVLRGRNSAPFPMDLGDFFPNLKKKIPISKKKNKKKNIFFF